MCDTAEAKHIKFLCSIKVSGTENNKGRILADNFMKMQRNMIATDSASFKIYSF